MKLPISVVIVSLVGIGCKGGSGGGENSYKPTPPPKIEPVSVKAGEEKSLFPIAVGNSWTYKASTSVRTKQGQRSGDRDATFTVSKIEDVPGGKRATLDLLVDGKAVDKQVWVVTDKSISQVSVGATKPRIFSTPIPAITFPVEVGAKFSWKGGDGKAQMAYNNEIMGAQEIDTDFKRLSAIAVDSKGTSVSGGNTEKTDRTIWFAPGIGIVRIRESTSSKAGASELLLSLKSHTVK